MKYAIETENLSKSYGQKEALSNLNIKVREGSVFGLLGANGAGKSTSIECILGTKKPSGGSARILGVDTKNAPKSLFESVGVQFQESRYQSKIRVGELCALTSALYGDSAPYRLLLEKFGIADKEKSEVDSLSGGERQRLFIALALIGKPKVVFFDELTSGLDSRARRDVWKILEGLKQEGLSVLLTSHFMDEVEALCDEICIIKEGKTVFYGTVCEAIAQSPHEKFEDAYLWYTD